MSADGEQWVFYFDPEKCIGCHGCVTACKTQNELDWDGPSFRRVTHVGEGEFPDYDETAVSQACMHCGNAPCEKVCPTDAITKRDSDGIVTVDQDKCIGCHYCAWACPYGAPKFDEGNDGKMMKCHMCLGHGPGEGDGKPPKGSGFESTACVESCVGEAIDVGPLSEMMKKASTKAAEDFAESDGNVIIEADIDPAEAGQS
jgi:anaerobic dimethyl sulfoxide reductase subunit B (iron-sulfur subunit)